MYLKQKTNNNIKAFELIENYKTSKSINFGCTEAVTPFTGALFIT